MAAPNPFGPAGWTPDRVGDLTGKVYAITGANSGIGFEASRLLAGKGARVLMLCRNPDKAADALERVRSENPGADVVALRADLADLGSVHQAAEEVREHTDRLDALIGNAGIMMVPDRRLTKDGFELQLGVNHLGHFALDGLLADLVEAAGGRFVAVSSGAHKNGEFDFDDLMFEEGYGAIRAYCRSKLANCLFVLELNNRLRAADRASRAFTTHPGYSATNLQSTGPGAIATAVMWVTNKLVAQSAERGSWPLVLAATDPEAKSDAYYGPTGPAESRGTVGECRFARRALDTEVAGKLWEASVAQTGVSWPLLEPG